MLACHAVPKKTPSSNKEEFNNTLSSGDTEFLVLSQQGTLVSVCALFDINDKTSGNMKRSSLNFDVNRLMISTLNFAVLIN